MVNGRLLALNLLSNLHEAQVKLHTGAVDVTRRQHVSWLLLVSGGNVHVTHDQTP